MHHFRRPCPLSCVGGSRWGYNKSATAGMAGKKKEGVLRAYRMTWNGMDLWQAYQACEKRGLDVGSWGNVQRGWPGCR